MADIDPPPGGLTNHLNNNINNNLINSDTNIVAKTQSYITYIVERSGCSVTYRHCSSDEAFFARCCSIPDGFAAGKLYCLKWSTDGEAVFSDLTAHQLRVYTNRRAISFFGSEYKCVVRSLLLGCRILDFEERAAIVLSTSPLLIEVPGIDEQDSVASFRTQMGDAFDVIIERAIYGSASTQLVCMPAGTLPRGLYKNSSLEIITSGTRRVPIVTSTLESVYRGEMPVGNPRLLEHIYGHYGSFSQPLVDPTLVKIRIADGGELVLDAARSEAVRRIESASCPGIAVEGGPGTGKTLLAVVMALRCCEDGPVLLLSSSNPTFLAHYMTALDTADKRILHLEPIDTPPKDRSPYSIFNADDKENMPSLSHFDELAEQLERASSPRVRRDIHSRMRASHAAALAVDGDQDIIIADVETALEMAHCLCGVKTVIVDDAQGLSEAALSAVINRFRKAKVALLGDPCQLPYSRRGDVASQLAGIPAIEVFKRKGNLPCIKLTTTYRAAPELMRHYSSTFYGGTLVSCAHEREGIKLAAICPGVTKNCLFINVWASKAIPSDTSLINDEEMAALEGMVGKLRLAGYDHRSVLVVSFYDAQRQLALTRLPTDYEVVTVEESQGREADIIILLTTQHSPGSDDFITSHNRVNIAVSRHREALIVIGSEALLTTDPWYDVINHENFAAVHYVRK